MKYTSEEIIKKFGDIELSFNSYYKYSFTYSYKNENIEIYGSFGGCSDDIYRYDCSSDKKVKVSDYSNELHSLTIKENDEVVFEYDDY